MVIYKFKILPLSPETITFHGVYKMLLIKVFKSFMKTFTKQNEKIKEKEKKLLQNPIFLI